LPKLLDPWLLIETGASFEGALALSSFPRLADFLLESEGEATYWLGFTRDAERRGIVRGEVRARLRLVCQRCLGAVDYPVERAFTLAPVRGLDEIDRLRDDYEPLLLSGEQLHSADLVEDELLLALPQIPTHGPGECEAPTVPRSAKDGAEVDLEAPRPFAALAEWKRGSGN
jgi:uncharacterized protein